MRMRELLSLSSIRYRAGAGADGSTMVANDGFCGIIAARYRLMMTPKSVITATISGGAHCQPQQDRGRDGDDANVSRHSDFLLHSVS
jgi:hypothetical protein